MRYNNINMDKSYEEIRHNEKLIAIILYSNYTSDKIEFFTPGDFSQQLGFLPHKKGNIIHPHFHKEVERNITRTQEVLVVKKGKVLVEFYTEDKKFIDKRELNTGDVILLCSGGHGFRMLDDTEMIEIKQGPYLGADDKERFEGIK